jgi:hypothetical protein
MNWYVSHANKIETPIIKNEANELLPPCTILAKDSSGQCHKYSGKLITPNQTNNLLESIVLFSWASTPDEIINVAPNVGNSALQPGNSDSLDIQ